MVDVYRLINWIMFANMEVEDAIKIQQITDNEFDFVIKSISTMHVSKMDGICDKVKYHSILENVVNKLRDDGTFKKLGFE